MLENTYTTDDLIERLALMRAYYSKRLFSGGTDATLGEVIGNSCTPDTLQALSLWLEKFQKDDISPLMVYEALDTVEEDIGGIPSVMLYVPIRFSHEHVVRFGRWFRENVQPNILLTMRTDPRMAGGCGLVWNSTFYDFSLRYSIHQHRDDVVAMFNKYSHAH